jgi:RNA polymerase-interacting CarD/CdnL/TRCF family regulator
MVGDDPTLAGLPEPGEPVFYPKVGHCVFRGVVEDRVAPGTRLLELEDAEEGSRILIPVERVPELHLRAAGDALAAIQEELSSKFEEPIEDDEARHGKIDELVAEGSARNLARALKRLHFLRQENGLSREDEQTRKKIRGWLAAEVAISKECTRAEAQAFLTRALQDAMSEHRRREKEEAKERRRAAKEQKKADAKAAAAAEEARAAATELDEAPPAAPTESAAPESDVASSEAAPERVASEREENAAEPGAASASEGDVEGEKPAF